MRICLWFKNSEETQPLLPNNGDNALHLVVRHARSAQDILTFRESLDVEAAAVELAVSVNNDNQLPIELLIENPHLNQQDKDIAFALLIALTLKNATPPLATAINKTDILEKYAYLGENSQQYQYINILCDVCNDVRAMIKASCTHPEANDLADRTRALISNEIYHNRKGNNVLAFFAPCTHPCDFIASPRTTVMKIWANSIREKGLGNCFEFTILQEALIEQRHPYLQRTFCYIPEADHVFLKLGEGATAVYGDAWSGQIYTEAEFLDKVKGFRRINYQDTFYNAVINFNPNVHRVETSLMDIRKAYRSMFLCLCLGLLIFGFIDGLLSHYMNADTDDDSDMHLQPNGTIGLRY